MIKAYSTPVILSESKLNTAPMDVFSRLLSDRIIFLGDEIASENANIIIAQLLYLDSLNHQPINLYINSPGGEVDQGLAILDTMNLIASPVRTIGFGLVASMATVLLASGSERIALPNVSVMIHQPSGGSVGPNSDIQIQAEQMKLCHQKLANILSKATKKPIDEIITDMDRDHWFTAESALEYGLIDKIK